MKNKINISIIGMGYVGLPLACKFGNHYSTIGFDIDDVRISQLKKYKDKTKEVSSSEIKNSKKLSFTSDDYSLKDSNIYIITVPTPINNKKKPDFRPLKSASKIVAKNLKLNDIVIYESTVYPGATEEVCVPILEKYSGLDFNEDLSDASTLKANYVTSSSNQYTTNIKKDFSSSILAETGFDWNFNNGWNLSSTINRIDKNNIGHQNFLKFNAFKIF